MRTPRSIPDLLPGALVTVRSLRESGVSAARLSRSDVDRPLRGVVRVGRDMPPADFAVRVEALRLILRDGQFFSRWTAAAILGIPVRRDDAFLHVGAIRSQRPPRRSEIRGHQISAGVLLSGPAPPSFLPHPSDVWALLGAVATQDELVVAGDYLISGASRWETPVATRDDLAGAALRFAGCSGVGNLARALPLIRTGVESPAESRMRLLIVRAGLPEPQTSCPVQVHGRTYVADLGYPHWRIAIEYEGAYHFANGVEQARRDNERVEAMRDAGWRVLRMTALALRDPRRGIARLRRAIAEATVGS